MPRHRQQGRPRHRAQRQGVWPGRRVPIGAVLAGLAQSAIAAVRRTAARPDSRRMLRGAMLTPWAAVSLGIVLAASLTLATPRAVLTFPQSTPARCQSATCGQTGGGQDGESLPTAKRGVRFPLIRTGPDRGLTSRTATPASPWPVRVQYAQLPRDGDHFVAVIVITGQGPLGNWTLRFAIPGSQIKLVMWARWKPAGQDGGIASGSPSAPSGANRARIVILGVGAPDRPGACVFDGIRCSFRDFSGGVSHFDWRPSEHGGR